MVDNDLDRQLFNAVKRNAHKKVQALIDQGANVNGTQSYLIGGRDWTLLMEASQSGYDKCVNALIRHGAHVNAKTESGTTALLESLRLFRSPTHLNCIYALIDHGADLNVQLPSAADNHMTPLMLATHWQYTDINFDQQKALILYLLENGADWTIETEQGGTALAMLARYKSQTEPLSNSESFYQNLIDLITAFIDKKTLQQSLDEAIFQSTADAWSGAGMRF